MKLTHVELEFLSAPGARGMGAGLLPAAGLTASNPPTECRAPS